MMPNLTWEEMKALCNRRCPDCDGFLWRPGPCGGATQNMECVGCEARFNIGYASARFAELINTPLPYVVYAERIDHDNEWREDMFPKVLQ